MEKFLGNRAKAILALEDGTLFEGNSIGIQGVSTGEVIFNTVMTGYQEVLTDPSYMGQIITFTYPHIGNTGINNFDNESNKIYASGVVIQSLSEFPSHWCSKQTLDEFLIHQKIVGVCGVDTRALTLCLRKKGALRGSIISISDQIDKHKAVEFAQQTSRLEGKDFSLMVTCKRAYVFNPNHLLYPHIVLIDYGVKKSILNSISNLGCKITIVPANISTSQLLSYNPTAIVLSNGPGDPQAMSDAIQMVKTLLKTDIPMFGICLGCQLLGLALGAKTHKMPFGHHGGNHPVQDLRDKSVVISTQNHGFCISDKDLPSDIIVTHRSLFDGSIQGIQNKSQQIMGLQGHPEAGPGPCDMKKYFQEFFDLMINSPMLKQQGIAGKTVYA